MKLKKLAQTMLLSCGILVLGACSSTANDPAAMAGAGDANGAQSSGVGLGDGFSDQGGTKSVLSKRTYYFDFDRSEVREEDKPAIMANADYLVSHPTTKIILEGHTDPRGSREYNVALGERRGNTVLEMLKSRGVNPSQVRVVSYGAERLATPGRTDEAFQLDRRAIIVYQN